MYRILIADDDILMREALEIMISKEKHFKVIKSVGTGEQVVKACKTCSVDIIFMDMQMPGMTGIEAARIISQKYPDISIYILSGHPANVLMQTEMRSTVKDFIEKPISSSGLKSLLNNYKTEHESSAQFQLEKLLEIIQERDFNKLYTDMQNIVDEIYEIAGQDSARLNVLFTFIGQTLLNTIEFYDDQKRSVEQLFPLNEGLILDRKTSEIWLFRVMDYLFQKNSVNRYPLLENVFCYIEKYIKEDISLNRIIENCAISQGYLSRIFREQFNTSVMEYLHMKKMHLAKAYFYFTDDSIAEVAFRLGYNESSYFSKVFKKYEHMTVKQYKQMINETASG